MTDEELRALVRDAVARHLGTRAAGVSPAAAPSPAPPVLRPQAAAGAAGHFSHAVYLTLVNPGDSCVIEPGVPCTHCNYCKSHGH